VSRRLIYAPRAREDIDAIRRWLLQSGSGARARQRLAAIRTAIRRLRQHPLLYPIGDYPGQRELSCGGGYRVMYRLAPDTGNSEAAGDVRIMRVFGPGQLRDQR
jgi:plasmid stabilization system protein ParE